MSYSDPTKLKEEIEKVVVLLVLLVALTSAAPTLDAPWGQIEGTTKVAPDNSTYQAYLGVPYALPPTGQRRFQRPAPHPGPQGVFRAVTSPPACPQPDPDTPNVSEDCLFLNVFTPVSAALPGSRLFNTSDNVTTPDGGNVATASALRPVVVVIHGGGSISGSADDVNAWKLVTHADVIVVAVQYRLGALGFLSTGDDVIAGNWALWDQKMALEWVQTNIQAFGGDPDAVTLMGDSAGAANAGLLSLQPACSGLFSKVLLQSGAPSASWAVLASSVARARAVALAQKLGCSLDVTSSEATSRAVLSCLRGQNASTLAQASRLQLPLATALTQNIWSAVVDGDLVLRHPEAALSDPDFLSGVPFSQSDLLLNLNNNEGALLLDFAKRTEQGTSLLTSRSFYRQLLLPALLQQRFGQKAAGEAVEETVAAFYQAAPGGGGGENVTLQAVLDTYSDFIFLAPAIHYARLHAQLLQPAEGSTLLLLLDHFPPDLPLGIGHSEEARYLGQLEEERDDVEESFPLTEEQYRAELEVSRTFVSLLARFFHSNRSQLPALPQPLSGSWTPYTAAQEHYVRVTSEPDVSQHPIPARLALHLDLLPALLRATTPPATTSSVTTPTVTTTEADDWLFDADRDTKNYVVIGLIALVALLTLILVAIAVHLSCRRKKHTSYVIDSENGTQKF